jgi:hypothetical protein
MGCHANGPVIHEEDVKIVRGGPPAAGMRLSRVSLRDQTVRYVCPSGEGSLPRLWSNGDPDQALERSTKWAWVRPFERRCLLILIQQE